MSKELNFKTNIQLKSIIGKDLINDDNIAILELVKNSFDADSKKVTVTFLNLKENDDNIVESYSNKTSRLIVQDNGLGMNLDDIENKWLNIAYSEKKSNKKQHNRLMAGAKGVGRFSCDRLGQYLNLYAKKKDSSQYIKLTINWKLFEVDDKNKEIQTIPLEYKLLEEKDLLDEGIAPFDKGQGICLEIIKLRSKWATPILDKKDKEVSWNTEKLVEIKKYLEKLINPSQVFEKKDDFGIFIDAPEFIAENDTKAEHDKFIGKIENRIFEKLDFKTTSIECKTLDEGKSIYTELKDRGEIIFWIRERNPFYPLIKNAKVTLYYLGQYSKVFFTRQTGIRSIDYGSIFLFVNGFRIPPYGEVDNDWLALNQRKTQGTNRFLGVREVIGNVEILDNDNDFQIISSREGIVKSENFLSLMSSKGNNSFIFKTFRRLERYVVEGIDWDRITEDLEDSFSKIEKKILSGELLEEDLEYREDERTKKQRVYATIHSIISAKVDDVEELYINENLILDKIDDERKRSEQEFEQLIKDFDNKKIDSDTLNRILLRKAEQNKDLEKQLKEFSKYETSPATTQAILELQQYKETIERQSRIIEDLKYQLQKLQKEKESRQELINILSEENKDLKETVTTEKAKTENLEKKLTQKAKQISFFQATQPLDKDRIIRFHHDIGIQASTIQNWLNRISKEINKGKLDIDSLKKILEGLTRANNKILSISRFATKAGFDELTENINTDIIAYIEQYSRNIFEEYFSIKVNLEDNAINDFKMFFKPLDISILLDNIVSNSIKAGAKNLYITVNEIGVDKIEFRFADDGNGLSKDVIDIVDVFEKGYTTTSGSGLGLYTCLEIVKQLKGEIKINNQFKYSEDKKGFELIIHFKK